MHKLDQNPEDFLNFMDDYGFEVYDIHKGKWFEKKNFKSLIQQDQTDLLFLRK